MSGVSKTYNPYDCIQKGGCGKILSRLGDYGLLVECNMKDCNSVSKTVCGSSFCSKWMNRESIDVLPDSVKKEILAKFPASKDGFFANRMYEGELTSQSYVKSKCEINSGLI